jgi:hypothetical protein
MKRTFLLTLLTVGTFVFSQRNPTLPGGGNTKTEEKPKVDTIVTTRVIEEIPGKTEKRPKNGFYMGASILLPGGDIKDISPSGWVMNMGYSGAISNSIALFAEWDYGILSNDGEYYDYIDIISPMDIIAGADFYLAKQFSIGLGIGYGMLQISYSSLAVVSYSDGSTSAPLGDVTYSGFLLRPGLAAHFGGFNISLSYTSVGYTSNNPDIEKINLDAGNGNYSYTSFGVSYTF